MHPGDNPTHGTPPLHHSVDGGLMIKDDVKSKNDRHSSSIIESQSGNSKRSS